MIETTKKITVGGIDISVTRKRIRHMHLSVSYADGRVKGSMPLRTSDAEYAAFVASKVDWLTRQISNAKTLAPTPICDGAEIIVFDEKLIVTVKNGSRNSCQKDGNVLLVTLKDGSQSALDAQVAAYRKECLAVALGALVPKYEATTGLACSSWYIRDMTTRWGSCNTKTHRIAFNLKLTQKPLRCLDYIVVHELGHIKYPNHGVKFKAYMNDFCPDWKGLKKLLNGK